MNSKAQTTDDVLVGIRAKVARYPGAFVALSFVTAFAVYALVSDETLPGMVVESSLLAVLAVGLVFVSSPQTLRLPPRGAGFSFLQFGLPVLVIAVVGLFQNEAALTGALASVSADSALRLVLIVVFCLATGVFEEGLFRIIAIGSFMKALSSEKGPLRHPLIVSALASALLFGLLHASTGVDGALKPVQAVLFGLIMAALYAQTRNLWPAALTHALFNALSMGPYLLIGDHAQEQLLDGTLALHVMIVSIALLIPLALFAFFRLRQLERRALQGASERA